MCIRDSTETADTRSWSLLPESFSITRIRLKPGVYKIQIHTDGRLSKISTVRIQKGKIRIIRDVG